MRNLIRKKLAARAAQRVHRGRFTWSPTQIGLACAAYFGGALIITIIGGGWPAVAWLALGPVIMAFRTPKFAGDATEPE